MKKLHITAITVSGLAAAMVGLAAHALPTDLPTVFPHRHWYRTPPLGRRLPAEPSCPEGLDTSVRHSGRSTLSSTRGTLHRVPLLRAGARPGQTHPVQGAVAGAGGMWRMHSTSRGLRTRLCDALGTRPLLTVAEMAVLGANIDLATEWERQRITQLGLYVRSSQDLADAPEAVTRDATHWLLAGESAVRI